MKPRHRRDERERSRRCGAPCVRDSLRERNILVMSALLLCIGAPVVTPPHATISRVKHPLILSTVGPSNPLPSFSFLGEGGEGGSASAWRKWNGGLGQPRPYVPPDTSDDFVWQNRSADLRVPLLPWLTQDAWGCEQKPGEVDMIKLENDDLEVLIAPQFGGKIWRAYDKRMKRELFLNNPALQPANFANRGAWVSGGVEFNWNPGRIGHSEFTLSPVYAASLSTERGPVVRVSSAPRCI